MNCCACAGSCCHTGEHSYCVMHRVGWNMVIPSPRLSGWTCPSCGACYAPWVAQCAACPKAATTVTQIVTQVTAGAAG